MNKRIAILVVLGIAMYVSMSSIYTVSEVEQMSITQFGKPVGAPVTSAGLKVKVPLVAFYEFTRIMQSYKSIIAKNTTLVLSTDRDLFKFLKGMNLDGDGVPVRGSGAQ